MATWNLADLFERVVDAVGDREAVVSGADRLTFSALDASANRVAAWLTASGIEPGQRVGLALHNHALHVTLLLAAFKVRAVPLNLNLRYTAAELRAVLVDAGAVVVVHEAGMAEVVAAAADDAPSVRLTLRGGDLEDVVQDAPATRPTADRSGDDLYVLYTGGTTGAPRGVLWRHEDLVFGALSGLNPGSDQPLDHPEDVEAVARRGPGSRLLPACPLTHGTAQWMTCAALLAGDTVVLDPSPRLDAAHVWDLVDEERVSRLAVVGDAVARPLVDALDAEPDRWNLDSLVVIASGGAMLSPAVRHAILDHLPGVAVLDGFGASESGGHGRTVLFAGQSGDQGGGVINFQPDETTAVLDEELRPLPPGSGRVGRVARRGPIPLGYVGDPERSAATFPVVDGVRWAIPGDLATVEADGRITVLGRDAATINTGGEKVYAEEVEAVLKEHPDVADAVVVGVPDERWGSKVAAVVALRAGVAADAHALEAHCRDRLAAFKVPKALRLMAEVQRTPSGKADLAWARSVLTGDRG